ncbi:hypothetical protein [Puniceibacterium confluentis]|uniref:hypothetical protein n=1 Tax=Puniceibacterium confluentis TaxID=1958944 RepID=UPI0011B49A7B|nr:hypothetical protein [Puniceibacterium confluentis]
METVTNHPPVRLFGVSLSFVSKLAAAFRWARAVQDECDRWETSGRRLDGPTIVRIVDRVNAA